MSNKVCDLLCSINGDRATVLSLYTINQCNSKWVEIVQKLLHTRHTYNRNDVIRIKPGVMRGMIDNGSLTREVWDKLKVHLPRLRYGGRIKILSALKEILGKDNRGKIYRINTFPWSSEELKRFLVVRARCDGDIVGKQAYWKRDFGFTSGEINSIQSTSTIWHPKYSEVHSVRYFS